jgi:hypothetical protein
VVYVEVCHYGVGSIRGSVPLWNGWYTWKCATMEWVVYVEVCHYGVGGIRGSVPLWNGWYTWKCATMEWVVYVEVSCSNSASKRMCRDAHNTVNHSGESG